jgi:hypothetical protein
MIAKDIMIFFLKTRKLTDCANEFGFNREKIRQSLIHHYPYIYNKSNSMRLRKMILTSSSIGWSEVVVNKSVFKIDTKYVDFFNSSFFRKSTGGYLVATEKIDGHKTSVYYHRVILGAKNGQEVDHINIDKSDNTLENLRLCTRKENSLNKVCNGFIKAPHNKKNPYVARFKGKHIGYFKTKNEAQLAYINEKMKTGDFFGRLKLGNN